MMGASCHQGQGCKMTAFNHFKNKELNANRATRNTHYAAQSETNADLSALNKGNGRKVEKPAVEKRETKHKE